MEECESCSAPEKSIDDCYHEVLRMLTELGRIQTVSTQLASLTSDQDRTLYLHGVVKELGLLPIIMTNPKNDQVSLYYRCHGNEYFKLKCNYDAWQCYNLSLLYAEPTSENFSYAISNRSAVFFAMGRYKECLEDLNFLFRTAFPENLQQKLRNRKKNCEAFLENSSNDSKDDEIIDDILKFKGLRNERYLCASSKLKVVYTKEMGRHVIANENIAVGEILAQEDPYLVVLLKSQFLFTCAYCLSKTLNLYPCLSCCFVLYCSVECREQAFKEYHIIECDLMVNLISMDFTKLEWLAFRIMLKSRSDYSTWFEIFKSAQDADKNILSDIWGCVKDGEKWVFDSKQYPAVHTLATNVQKRSVSDLFRKSLSAAVITHFMSVMPFMGSNDSVLGVRATNFMAGNLLRHMMTSPTNMHDISTIIQNEEGNYVDDCSIASGVYPFLSLINHACAPNVVRYSKLGSSKMSLIAIRPIKKGMQIFDNYGSHHALQDRSERQSNLNFQYKFTCTCEACVNDWPIHLKLQDAHGLPAGVLHEKQKCLSPEVLDELMKGDKATAVKVYKQLCNLVEILDSYAPCRELSECQEAMKQCLAIFNGMIPYGHSETIQWRAFPPCQALGGGPHIGEYLGGPAFVTHRPV